MSINVGSLALSKSYSALVALGLTDVSVEGTTVTFTIASTGEKASVTLPTPKDGVSISNLEVNSKNEMIVTMSDSSVVNAGTIKTLKGDKGDQGIRGLQGIQGVKGDTGYDGKSAYEVALDNGFVGTQSEWLESLKGSNIIGGSATEISTSTLSGDITPDISGAYSIGSSDKKLKAIYANEVYMSSNTLYINGTPVFHTDNSDDLMFTADENQSIKVKTTGDATTNILSEQDVDIRTTKEASNINIGSGDMMFGTSSNVNVTASNNISNISNNQITNKAKNVVLDGAVAIRGGLTVDDLSVSGNVTVGGSSLQIDSDNLKVKDNIIVINDGEIGVGVTAG